MKHQFTKIIKNGKEMTSMIRPGFEIAFQFETLAEAGNIEIVDIGQENTYFLFKDDAGNEHSGYCKELPKEFLINRQISSAIDFLFKVLSLYCKHRRLELAFVIRDNDLGKYSGIYLKNPTDLAIVNELRHFSEGCLYAYYNKDVSFFQK